MLEVLFFIQNAIHIKHCELWNSIIRNRCDISEADAVTGNIMYLYRSLVWFDHCQAVGHNLCGLQFILIHMFLADLTKSIILLTCCNLAKVWPSGHLWILLKLFISKANLSNEYSYYYDVNSDEMYLLSLFLIYFYIRCKRFHAWSYIRWKVTFTV